jgi:hypothetical protein
MRTLCEQSSIHTRHAISALWRIHKHSRASCRLYHDATSPAPWSVDTFPTWPGLRFKMVDA